MSSTLTAEEIQVRREFNDLLDTCTRCNKRGDKALIRKAFKIAYNAHKGALRMSGEPYILHPIAVAKIVTQEMGLGVKAIVSAFCMMWWKILNLRWKILKIILVRK